LREDSSPVAVRAFYPLLRPEKDAIGRHLAHCPHKRGLSVAKTRRQTADACQAGPLRGMQTAARIRR